MLPITKNKNKVLIVESFYKHCPSSITDAFAFTLTLTLVLSCLVLSCLVLLVDTKLTKATFVGCVLSKVTVY